MIVIYSRVRIDGFDCLLVQVCGGVDSSALEYYRPSSLRNESKPYYGYLAEAVSKHPALAEPVVVVMLLEVLLYCGPTQERQAIEMAPGPRCFTILEEQHLSCCDHSRDAARLHGRTKINGPALYILPGKCNWNSNPRFCILQSTVVTYQKRTVVNENKVALLGLNSYAKQCQADIPLARRVPSKLDTKNLVQGQRRRPVLSKAICSDMTD
ncbi:hypothetical protein BJ166DRAFT_102935 [Pestalotiopsis sp. NC0098]|nr:hypothetical protein BJ166DRAFT_102935 [Pestalotiopsis sp. NC0098]